MENNKMISFRELIEECFNKYVVYIPLKIYGILIRREFQYIQQV